MRKMHSSQPIKIDNVRWWILDTNEDAYYDRLMESSKINGST